MFFISETFSSFCVSTSHSDATDWHSLWCQDTWPVSGRCDCILIIEMARRRHDVIRLMKFSCFSWLELHWWDFLNHIVFEELSRFLHVIHIVCFRRILNLRFEKLLALRIVVHTRLANHRREFTLHRDSRELRLVWRVDYHSLPSYRDSRSAWLLLHARSHLARLLIFIIAIASQAIDLISIVTQENIIVVVLHLVLGHKAVKLLFVVLVDVHRYLAAMLALVVIWIPIV